MQRASDKRCTQGGLQHAGLSFSVAPGSCSTRTPRMVLTSEPDDEDAFYGDLMSSSFGGKVEMILPIE